MGGITDLIANLLYNEMLGSLPDFHSGSAVAIIMLLPSVISIALTSWLSRYNIRYSRISRVELSESRKRDFIFGLLSLLLLGSILMILLVIFIVPFVKSWPYVPEFTTEHVKRILGDFVLVCVYTYSLLISVLTALF